MSGKKLRKERHDAQVAAAKEETANKIPRWLDVGVTINPGPRGYQETKMPIKMPDGETKIVPVSFTVPEDARDGQKITLRMTVQGPPEDVPPPPTAAMIGGVEEEEWRLRDQFRFRRMPWWVVFMVGVYGILKVVALYESPCAVLGVASPVEKRAVTKAYRSLSMCTHPDRMVGKTDADKDRGEVLFTRMTEARDELNDYLDKGGRQSNCREHPNCVPGRKEFGEKKFLKRCSKPQSVTFRGASETETLSMLCPCSCKDFAHPEGGVDAVSCYRDMLEVQVMDFLTVLPEILGQTTGQDVWALGNTLKNHFISIVTLEAGIMGSISSLLFLSMVWRMLLMPAMQFVYRGTVFQSIVSVPTGE